MDLSQEDIQVLTDRAARGGRHQRAKALALLSTASAGSGSRFDFDSALGKSLIKEWAWGQTSAVEVQ